MPSDAQRLTAAELGERIIDALVPALPPPPGPLPPSWHVPPTWPQVWSEVRTVCGPVRGVFFIAWVVVSYPVLFIVARLVAHPVVTALLLTAVLGTAAREIGVDAVVPKDRGMSLLKESVKALLKRQSSNASKK